jgi:hypothetical protein
MDIIDIFWQFSQDDAIKTLKDLNDRTAGRGAAQVKRLQDENHELRLRLSLLIRLLIDRGVFTAADYSTLLEDTKAKLAASKPSHGPRRPRIPGPSPANIPPASSASPRKK